MLARVRSLIRGVFRRTRVEQDMAEELRFHLEARIEDLVRQSVDPAEAGRRARVEFGSRETCKERCRQARGLRFPDEVRQDIGYAMRSLGHNPGFTLAAVLSLALGIGLNTAIFSLLDAIVLRSLPVGKPGELALVREYPEPNAGRFSYPMFEQFERVREREDSLMAMGRVASLNAWLTGDRQPATATGQLVSGGFFSTLGVSPAIGRLLSVEDNRAIDGRPVAVISYGFWQNRLGGASSVLGREIKLNTVWFTIVGVARRGFSGVWADKPEDVWIPLAMQHGVHYSQDFSNSEGSVDRPWLPQDGIRWLDIVSRTTPDGHGRLEAALNWAFQQANARYADHLTDPAERRLILSHHVVLEPFGRGFSALRTDFGAALAILMAMVGLVLFVACANVANLLLARSASRRGEMAMRLSMGAGRARLIRQLLTESVLLALAGGVTGVVLAFRASTFLAHVAPRNGSTTLPPAFTPDVRVLGFAALLSFITGILFGAAPALRATRTELGDALKACSRNVAGDRLKGMRPLVVLQITLSLLLVAVAGLFTRSLRHLSHLDVGFDREHLLAVWIDTKIPGYPRSRLPLLYRRLTARLEAVPGVRSVSVSMCGLDTDCGSFEDGIEITGYERRPGEQILLQVNNVGLKYFETAGIGLVKGRDFDTRDGEGAPRVAIINQEMARRYFFNRSALGQRFGYGHADTEIIGVVRDARVTNVAEQAVPMAYYPMEQNVAYAANLDLRVVGDPRWMKERIRRIIAEVDPDLPVRRVATVAEQIDDSLTPARAVVYLTSAFGFLALAIACVGVYGVMNYGVIQRTAELGIRMALGASGSRVLWMVLRESLLLVVTGLALGLPLVLACSRSLSSLLFGLSPDDPATLLFASLAVAVVVIIAGYVPALRAAQINPMVALRHE